MSYVRERGPRIPPRWFVRLAWYTHRALYRVTGGRIGLWRARSNRWGTLRLTTIGRRTQQERSAATSATARPESITAESSAVRSRVVQRARTGNCSVAGVNVPRGHSG